MNPNIFKSNAWFHYRLALIAVAIGACTPDEKELGLNPLPTVDFEIAQGADANSVILVNKTNAPSIPFWSVSTGQTLSGDSARLRLIFAGTYHITLLVAAQGGLDSITKPVTIAQNDPDACDPANAIGFIAGCMQKTWKLNPEAQAYKVGEGVAASNFWSSTADDVVSRACEFNDEYTFSFNAEGTFEYDNKGDFFGDGYLGNGNGCQPNSNLPAAQQPWASGLFSFTVIDGAGVRGLGQLRVNGSGAHIGLQKVHNGGETTSGPAASSITYDIIEMTQHAGFAILQLGVNIGGITWWTFTLRSEN